MDTVMRHRVLGVQDLTRVMGYVCRLQWGTTKNYDFVSCTCWGNTAQTSTAAGTGRYSETRYVVFLHWKITKSI